MQANSSAKKRIFNAALKLFAERGSTQVSVSDLATAANVSRGTIYNNNLHPDTLFQDICSQLSEEMNHRVISSFGEVTDPAHRLAQGIRMYLRRAHEEPDWARFICAFAFNKTVLIDLWTGLNSPIHDLNQGVIQERYSFQADQTISAVAMLAGSVLTGMYLVLEGYKTWRDAGSDLALMMLMGLGISGDEARTLAQADLPVLLDVE